MPFRFLSIACAIAICFFDTSCSSKAKAKYKKVPLTKVTGAVTVDGKEVSGVIISYKPKGEIAEKDQRFLSGFNVMSAAEGKFALKTYESGDGIPAGDYELFCQYYPIEGDDPRTSKAATDVLNGKYVKDPAKEFTVVDGKPLDLGKIELNTAKATTAKKK